MQLELNIGLPDLRWREDCRCANTSIGLCNLHELEEAEKRRSGASIKGNKRNVPTRTYS